MLTPVSPITNTGSILFPWRVVITQVGGWAVGMTASSYIHNLLAQSSHPWVLCLLLKPNRVAPLCSTILEGLLLPLTSFLLEFVWEHW